MKRKSEKRAKREREESEKRARERKESTQEIVVLESGYNK